MEEFEDIMEKIQQVVINWEFDKVTNIKAITKIEKIIEDFKSKRGVKNG